MSATKARSPRTVRQSASTDQVQHYQVMDHNLAVTVRVRLKDNGRPYDVYIEGTQFEVDIPGIEWLTPANRLPNRLYASDPVAAHTWLQKNAAIILDTRYED